MPVGGQRLTLEQAQRYVRKTNTPGMHNCRYYRAYPYWLGMEAAPAKKVILDGHPCLLILLFPNLESEHALPNAFSRLVMPFYNTTVIG